MHVMMFPALNVSKWLVVDIEIKVSDDGFQAEHRLTDTGPES